MNVIKLLIILYVLIEVIEAYKEPCPYGVEDVFNDLKTCCNVNFMNISGIAPNCENYTLSNIFPNSEKDGHYNYANPCFIECMLKEYNVLDEEHLYVDKLESFLRKLYDADQNDIIDLAFAGIKDCATNVHNKIKIGQRHGYILNTPNFHPRAGLTCSWVPITMVLCTHRKIFQKCPKRHWNNSKNCLKKKEFYGRCYDTTNKGTSSGLKLVSNKEF